MYPILFILSVIIVLIPFMNYSDKKLNSKKNNRYINSNKTNQKIFNKKKQKNCKMSTNINSYQCYIKQSDLCPISSYKQCNNHYNYKSFPPNLKNDCRELNNRDTSSYLLSQNCLLKNKVCYNWRELLKKDTIMYPKFYPRVNTWKSSISNFTI